MTPTNVRGPLPTEKEPAEDFVLTMRKILMSGSVTDVKGEALIMSINPSELLAYSSFDYFAPTEGFGHYVSCLGEH